jgi:hypothetical protein
LLSRSPFAVDVWAQSSLPGFSALTAGGTVTGWAPYTLGGKAAPADFRLVELDGSVVLRAEASNAASALIHTGRFDPLATPWLNWRWRADELPAGGRFATRDGDDYALRIYVLFDYDLSKLGFGTRTKIRLARAFYGEQVPTAVLCYVWDARAAPGTRAWSAYTDRVRMIAVDGAGSVARRLAHREPERRGRFPGSVRRRPARHHRHRGRQRHRQHGRPRARLFRRPVAGRAGAAVKRLVLLGGGHAHLFVLEAFAKQPPAAKCC